MPNCRIYTTLMPMRDKHDTLLGLLAAALILIHVELTV